MLAGFKEGNTKIEGRQDPRPCCRLEIEMLMGEKYSSAYLFSLKTIFLHC